MQLSGPPLRGAAEHGEQLLCWCQSERMKESFATFNILNSVYSFQIQIGHQNVQSTFQKNIISCKNLQLRKCSCPDPPYRMHQNTENNFSLGGVANRCGNPSLLNKYYWVFHSFQIQIGYQIVHPTFEKTSFVFKLVSYENDAVWTPRTQCRRTRKTTFLLVLKRTDTEILRHVQNTKQCFTPSKSKLVTKMFN